jgi:Acyl-coenzyme A:6-aminopenicillanic acid acyl-transferase
MQKKFCILIIIACFSTQVSNACTIFSCARKGKVFAAANEDDYTPFTRIWYNPPTPDRYGSVCFGAPDMQVAAAMNEYGLFFDAAAASYDLNKLNLKNPYKGFLLWEVLGKCKNVKEALEIIRKYDYYSSSQMLLADREGNSVLINPEGIIEKTGTFQVNANCNVINKKVECSRPAIVNEVLSNTSDISVDLCKEILDRAHQEGDLTTLYSTVCDLKKGIIYVYFFHNFTHVYKIDLKEELKKGYRIEMLADHFPASFAYENFSKSNGLYLKESIVDEISKNGLEVIDQYTSQSDSAMNKALLEVALQLIKYAWNEHANGGMWDYWFSLPNGYEVTTFTDKRLDAAARLLQYLLDKKFDNKLLNFLNEMYGYVNLVQGNLPVAKEFYAKAVAKRDETYEVSYLRAKEMLGRMER